MFFGYLLVVVGSWFFLENMGVIAELPTGLYWPVVVIIIGLWMVGKRKGYWCDHGKHGNCDKCGKSGMN